MFKFFKNIVNMFDTAWLGNALIVVFGAFVAFLFNRVSEAKKELKELIDSKASIDYVDERVDAARNEARITNEWVMRTLDRIDKRTELIDIRLNDCKRDSKC